MPDNKFPPPAFFFRLTLLEHLTAFRNEAMFQEVSGISPEITNETVHEGGNNQFIHRLPTTQTHQNLVLKRAIVRNDAELLTWCKNVLEGDISQPIETKTVTLELLGREGDQNPLRSWTFHDAYPVKWAVTGFNGQSNDVVIATLELAYKTVVRA